MGLTGGWFAALLVAAAVAAVAGTVVCWPRIRGPRPLRAAARIGMIAACQVTAIALVMVAVNDRYGFYASWEDLRGDANSGGAVAARYAAPVPDHPDYRAGFEPVAQGFRKATVHGWASGTRGEVLVWVPPQYGMKEYAHTRFPVIEVLHGIPGTPHSFLRGMRLSRILQQEITAGAAEPAVLVLPTITPDRVDTGCSDVPGRSRVATWLTDDVVKTVSRNFRVLPAPHGWAVMGISTGGYCAARLVLQFPEVFGAGAALAPDNPAQGRPSPVELIGHTGSDVRLLVESSLQDPESPPAYADALVRAAPPGAQVTATRLNAGGHNWNTWSRMFPPAFTWVSARLEAPRAVPSARSAVP